MDDFYFKIKLNRGSKYTKRTLLSDLNRVFDSLRFLVPVLFKGKILQQIWAIKVDWDCGLPIETQRRWCAYVDGLNQLEKIQIPRKVKLPFSIQTDSWLFRWFSRSLRSLFICSIKEQAGTMAFSTSLRENARSAVKRYNHTSIRTKWGVAVGWVVKESSKRMVSWFMWVPLMDWLPLS